MKKEEIKALFYDKYGITIRRFNWRGFLIFEYEPNYVYYLTTFTYKELTNFSEQTLKDLKETIAKYLWKQMGIL